MNYKEKIEDSYNKMDEAIKDYRINKHLYKFRTLKYDCTTIILERGEHKIMDMDVKLTQVLIGFFCFNFRKWYLMYRHTNIYRRHI